MFTAAIVVLALLAAGPARAADPQGAVAANDDAAAHLRAGRTAAAVAGFTEALELDPGSAELRRNLSVALATLGQEHLQAGRFDEARAQLERASELAPREAAYHLLLATIFLRRGDLYEARQRIDRTLELDPSLAEAREISGDLHYLEGRLERAREEWAAGLAAAPGPRRHPLAMKLERLDRESGAENRFARDVSRHFSIQYDGPVPGEVARTALRLLEEAYDRLWREFGRPPQHEVPVLLYSRELFDQVTRSPGWVAGTYDGKIRVPVGGLQSAADAERLGPILAHELTHAFIRANVPGRLPLWFEEGLAQHFQGLDPASAAVGVRGSAFPSLAAVDAALRGGPHVGAAYAAAALAVAEMVRMDGFWLPRRTLEHVAEGRPFPQAFRDASGMSLEEFEERWLRRLR